MLKGIHDPNRGFGAIWRSAGIGSGDSANGVVRCRESTRSYCGSIGRFVESSIRCLAESLIANWLEEVRAGIKSPTLRQKPHVAPLHQLSSPGKSLLSHTKHDATLTGPEPLIRFSETWQVLGPFQIGTREAAWGADPLEYYGGFHSLSSQNLTTTFRSSFGLAGVVTGTNTSSTACRDVLYDACIDLNVGFPDIDWKFLRSTYGWAALQWQGWARGNAKIQVDEDSTLLLYTTGILELWIDDVRHFGGDFFGFKRTPIVLHLSKGSHVLRLDVRLVRDVRSMGESNDAVVSVQLGIAKSKGGLVASSGILASDGILRDHSSLVGRLASITLRNDDLHDLVVTGINAIDHCCTTHLLDQSWDTALILVPGQTRPLAFDLQCACYERPISLQLEIEYQTTHNSSFRRLLHHAQIPVRPKEDLQRLTFMHPAGVVSYALLQSPEIFCSRSAGLPIVLVLHGAGVDVDSDLMRNAVRYFYSSCAWTLLPSGGTTWSGDDWHQWGMADVEAATQSIKSWIEATGWPGAGVDASQWVVAGHSNGGQGVWYLMTHRPDNVFAAAALSGYSSIQNYVPYTFWHASDPARSAMVQSALVSYSHEVLLENAEGIPVFQQHGADDDNVPPFHSRLLGQRLLEVGTRSEYQEIAKRGHWWDGILIEPLLEEFVTNQVDNIDINFPRSQDFSMVTANTGDMQTKNGVSIRELIMPGRLGKLDFRNGDSGRPCSILTSNIAEFDLSDAYHRCDPLNVNGQILSVRKNGTTNFRRIENGIWCAGDKHFDPSSRQGRQLGPLDSILRTHGHFEIVHCSTGISRLALQISRNLFQYYAADTRISSDLAAARTSSTGNVFTLAIGHSLPAAVASHPDTFRVRHDCLEIVDFTNSSVRFPTGDGIGAIFLRGLPDERLELVVWGSDTETLEMAARLVPMIAGTGQPDFVVFDKSLAWRGVDGALALGFLDRNWRVSKFSIIE